MSDNANLVVGVGAGGSDGTELAWFANTGTTAPTNATGALDAGFKGAGGVSEDGMTVAFNQETNDIRFYGSRTIQRRVIRSEEQTFQMTLMEHNEISLALYHNKALGSISPAVGTGAFSLTTGTSTALQSYAMVAQIVDGVNVTRIYCPNVQVTGRGNIVYSAGNPVGYEITLTAYPVAGVAIQWFYAIPSLG